MIELPDFSKSFEYENNFYLSCNINRISKIIAHWELYKMVSDLPGAIVECGVFKGSSLTRFAAFRDLTGNSYSKKIIAFDTFDQFPETDFADDQLIREKFINSAGSDSISKQQLQQVLQHKKTDQFIELVEGDITQTVPEYVKNHPELKISLLNLDTDIYEPAKVILECLYPKLVQGGILIIDDYGVFPGETKAVDEFFANEDVEIKKFPFCMTPCYIIK
ncbi:TylF/MycF/NovP-related O-methyltransferase [Cyanobacterium sp. DS4]|uniref:TylF/MycF/NovP-related O-methyltransferase n=1 Tax=Cyanobacterium sp. DS4 TaxID=2878255 RepID=UPI002E7FE485|nr:TylF/MycF/NovP-related O-methyltransferase [Cyanobacterium sp. Dongsha4]WVL02253.1 TylF/MycF family methyltransferase [Cyanobacterium sp. Dongsha4]